MTQDLVPEMTNFWQYGQQHYLAVKTYIPSP
jgi:hypothetical protein